MNKVLELLEQYCQWVAVAVGAAFLGWVLWAYILFSPVAQTMPDKASVDPGTVDAYVKKMQADPLQLEMDDPTPPSVPTTHVDLTKPWLAMLDGTAAGAIALRPDWADSIPQDVVILKASEIVRNNVLVEALPTLPPTNPLDIKSARAFRGTEPVAGNNQPAAPLPQPAAGAGAAAVPVAGKDISYVRLIYSIDPSEIDKQFKAAHIPPQAASTSIVEIKLMRQEKINGTWSDSVEIKPLSNNVNIQPLPPLGAQQALIDNFTAWVDSDQGMNDLLRPAFYTVLSGEGPWDAPIDDIAATNVDAETLRKQQLEENRKATEQRLREKKGAQPTGPTGGTPPNEFPPFGPGGPGGPGGENPRPGRRPPGRRPSGVVTDASRPDSIADLAGLQLAQAEPRMRGGNPPGNYPPGVYPPGVFPPGFPSPNGENGIPQFPGQPAAPAANNTPPLPAGNVFNPANQALIVGWAYDDTVQEGHTYQYQVVYAIRNPVYGANANIVAKAALAQQFAIRSAVSTGAWSAPITVKSTTEFYLASANWPANSIPSKVRMEVFKWANGKWQSKTFDVSPGDKIGSVENQTDFQTPVALIDIRFDLRRNKPYVLVMGNDGSLVEHEPSLDRNNPRHKQLQNIIAPPATPAAAGGGPLVPAG